tara:strand:+ start:4406 stop:4654 length:249 start_codon:yes stop_codon:yes gene_type:complete
MKGYASEILIACSAFIFPHNTAFSIVLVVLGCLGAIIRFTVSFNQTTKKEKLYDSLSEFIKKIVESGNGNFDPSFFKKENIH